MSSALIHTCNIRGKDCRTVKDLCFALSGRPIMFPAVERPEESSWKFRFTKIKHQDKDEKDEEMMLA